MKKHMQAADRHAGKRALQRIPRTARLMLLTVLVCAGGIQSVSALTPLVDPPASAWSDLGLLSMLGCGVLLGFFAMLTINRARQRLLASSLMLVVSLVMITGGGVNLIQ